MEQYRLRGPMAPDDVPLYRWIQAERDLHFARMVLAMRKRGPRWRTKVQFWSCIWVTFDLMLPKRWQITRDAELMAAFFLVMPLKDLKEQALGYEHTAETYRAVVGQNNRHAKESYRFTNTFMKPLLNGMGYRSLAEFQRAWDITNGKSEWPKIITKM